MAKKKATKKKTTKKNVRKKTAKKAVKKKVKAKGAKKSGGRVAKGERGASLTLEEETRLIKALWGKNLKWFLTGFAVLAAILGTVVGTSLFKIHKAATQHIEGIIVDRIVAEFNEPCIKKTVQDAATHRANAIIEDQVQPAVAKFTQDFNDLAAQVKHDANQLESDIASFASKMMQLSEKQATLLGQVVLVQNYQMTLINAQTGYRKAYDQLLAWGEDESYLLQQQAMQVWQQVTRAHNPVGYRGGWSASVWYPKGDPSTLSLPELTTYYQQQASLDYRKPAIIEHIYKRDDIATGDKLKFLVGVIEKDDSLDAVEYAGRFFGQLAGVKLHPLAVPHYLKWWAENKDTLGDIPKE